ncbi:MAG: hypothetical protein ABSD08_13675 [Xanthobacteraceae bacterium]|jgi:hypothetical protein
MTRQTTPPRQRMIEDMTLRNMSLSTQKIYVRAVANFSIFHGRPRRRSDVFSGKRWENQVYPIVKNVILSSD